MAALSVFFSFFPLIIEFSENLELMENEVDSLVGFQLHNTNTASLVEFPPPQVSALT